MKDKFYEKILPILIISIFTFGLVSQGQAAATKTYNLKIDTFWGPKNHATESAVIPTIKAIEKETNGQVKFEVFYAQSLAKNTEGYDATAMGLLDVCTLTGPNYEPGNMIRSAVFSLPFALPLGKNNVDAATRIMENVYKKQIFQEIDPNVIVIGWGVTSGYRFMTIKKVETIKDIRGMTLRSSGGYHDDIIRAVGASPEAMAPGDIHEALGKGILDGVFHTYAAQYGWGTYEPLNYATEIPVATFPFYTMINKRKYDSLPAESKLILSDQFKKLGAKVGSSYYLNGESHLKEMGIEETVFSDQEKIKFSQAIVLPVWQKWIGKCEERKIDWRAIIKALEGAWKENNLEPNPAWVGLVK